MAFRGVCVALLYLASVADVVATVAVDQQTVVYGKYYSLVGGSKSTVDNSYFMYRPQGQNVIAGKLPVIIQIHGGGFTGGRPTTSVNDDIQKAVNNGIAYISVGYRLVATKYYFGNDQLEELINVDADGKLTIDQTGKTMKDYQIRRGRQEYNTKCSYDAAQMIEHLIAHADEYGIDVHRITTTGGSAGGGEINYLTWVYHQWNSERYTPKGMVYTMAQLDYPVQNMLDRVWKLWADDVGENTMLSSILAKSDCSMIVGNPWCSQSSDYNLCNKTYQSQSEGRFCGDSFEKTTLGEVRDSLVWPADDPEVGKGMEVLWYNSDNMQKHQPKPFYLYVFNSLNSTAGMNVVHNALYARNFAKYSEMAGINYTVYYTDYHAMTKDDAGDQRYPAMNGRMVLNYRSSHDWVNQPGVKGTDRGSNEEQLLYHCLALGVQCSVSPSPSPSPPGTLSADCKKEVDRVCPTQRSATDCRSCVSAHQKEEIDAGCPRGPGAAQSVINYCQSRATVVV